MRFTARIVVAAACVIGPSCSFFVDSDDLTGSADATAADARRDDALDEALLEASGGDATPADGGSSDAARDAVADCGTDVSFIDDPKNCGACGHDCLGGVCSQSKCGPVTLTNGQAGAFWLAIDGTSLYWTDGTSIRSCPKTGCAQPSIVAQGRSSILEVGVGSGSVFWTECESPSGDGGAYRCAASGCGQGVQQLVQGAGCLSGIALDEPTDTLFYASVLYDTVSRCTAATCSLASSSQIGTGQYYVSGMTLVNGTPYWLRTLVGLSACNAPSCLTGARVVATSSRNAVTPPSIVNGVAYWATYVAGASAAFAPNDISQINTSLGGGTVVRAPINDDGGAAEVLVSGGSSTAVVADSSGFRFTDFLGGALLWCPSSGCDGGAETVAVGQGKPFALVQDDAAIYWINWGDGRLMKLAK